MRKIAGVDDSSHKTWQICSQCHVFRGRLSSLAFFLHIFVVESYRWRTKLWIVDRYLLCHTGSNILTPFTDVGVDYSGPFYVRQGRWSGELAWYWFLHYALRRFINLRGCPTTMTVWYLNQFLFIDEIKISFLPGNRIKNVSFHFFIRYLTFFNNISSIEETSKFSSCSPENKSIMINTFAKKTNKQANTSISCRLLVK